LWKYKILYIRNVQIKKFHKIKIGCLFSYEVKMSKLSGETDVRDLKRCRKWAAFDVDYCKQDFDRPV